MPTPEEIASRQFLISLRGYDREEVTSFLAEVADGQRQLEARIEELEVRLDDAGARAVPEGDDREAFRRLGDETTRILVAAQDAAEEMRRRAEEESRATLDDARRTATDQVQTARRTAQDELEEARRRATEVVDEARATAEREVAEAQSTAERTVADADARRDAVEATVRELEAVRDRLLEALDGTVRVVTDATAGLRGTPVGEVGARPPDGEAPAPAGPAGEAEVAAAVEGAATVEAAEPRDEEVEAVAPGAADEPAGAAAAPPPADEDTATARTSADAAAEDAAVVAPPPPTAEEVESAAPDPTVAQEPAPETAAAADGPADEEPAEEQRPRDRSLAGIRPGMLRRLKRTLQDVQNGVLDAIRRTDGRAEPRELLPTPDDLAPIVGLAETFLTEAYLAGLGDGAASAGRDDDGSATDPSRVAGAARSFGDAIAHEVVASVEATLRAGVEAGEEPTTLSERVGEVFRDLKGPVAEATVEAALVRTYELGELDAWRGAGVAARVWVVGPEPRCPENRCRGNAEEGAVDLGEDFPSGDAVPPAHPGCTCTLAPA